MIYRKLHRTYSHGYANFIPDFKEVFPELKGIDGEELANRLKKLKLDFYYEEKTAVSPIVRTTLPLALLVWVLMFVGLPINFWITGRWGYSIGNNSWVLNWFRALNFGGA